MRVTELALGVFVLEKLVEVVEAPAAGQRASYKGRSKYCARKLRGQIGVLRVQEETLRRARAGRGGWDSKPRGAEARGVTGVSGAMVSASVNGVSGAERRSDCDMCTCKCVRVYCDDQDSHLGYSGWRPTAPACFGWSVRRTERPSARVKCEHHRCRVKNDGCIVMIGDWGVVSNVVFFIWNSF